MSEPSARDLLARDARVSWHPYTQHATAEPPLAVRAARGATLELDDGRVLIDAISSWWATLHGHGRRELIEAAAAQMETLDHVLFAGCTHEPAVQLAERLLEVAPAGLERVFWSDDGSTAVEVALKMVAARWHNAGEAQRRTFVALAGGYHGDTFGAMAVGDPDPFFETWRPWLFEVRRAAPEGAAVEAAVAELGPTCAGVIVEPLVQGAAGMRMHSEATLRAIRATCDRHGVPLLADEVMTGFGRTGATFACQRAGVAPDLLCLAKGLTGGTFPLAATLARAEVFESFLSPDRARAFFHGHTFTAHPVGCALGLASIELVQAEGVPARLDAIGARIESALRPALAGRANVRDLRRTGGIVAFDLVPPAGQRAGYLAELGPRLRREAIERGVLLRPLGNTLYAMPPACTSEDECDRIAAVLVELARA